MKKNTYKIQQEKEKKPSLFSKLDKKLGGDLEENGLPVRYLPHVLFIVAIAIFYIGNSHYAEKTIRKIDDLEQEVEDLRADYTTLKSEYMYMSKQSEVAKRVKKIGLEESKEPPYKIIVEEK